MPESLSPPQAEILNYYKAFIAGQGRAPSVREVATALHRNPGNVHYHIRNLERQGLLVRTGGHRGVRLVSRETRLVPLLGVVACGEPITVFEEADEHISVPDNFLREGYGHYALRAKGNSMIEADIRDGDLLVIRRQDDVADGNIAVVITGEPPFEGATLKTVYHQRSAMLLKPANKELDPYVVRDGQVRGKLVGVIRHLEGDQEERAMS